MPISSRIALRSIACSSLLLLLSVLTLATEARAETTFTVTYKTAEVCPSRGDFIRDIQTRSRIAKPVGQAEQPDVVFVVEIAASKQNRAKFHGKLVITEGVKTTDRKITGQSCKEVASALSLIAALTIDPMAETGPSLPPLPIPPDPAGPPVLDTAPALITGPAPVIVPASLPPLPLSAGMHAPTADGALLAWPLPIDVSEPPWAGDPGGLDFGFGARFVLEAGTAPSPLVGVAGHLELRDLAGPAWSLRAEVSYTTVTQTTLVENLNADGAYRMVRGRLIGCVPGWHPVKWFRLWPCASAGGGGLWASLSNQAGNTAEAAGPWFELGLSARADLIPLRWLAFEIQAGPQAAVVRGAYGTDTDLQPNPVAFGLGVGASAAF